MFENLIAQMATKKNELENEERELFKAIAKSFMAKYKTNTIHFNLYCDAPSWEYIGGDADIQDGLITKIIFDIDGSIKSISCHLYYAQEDWDDCDEHDFLNRNYLDIAEYIDAQIEMGQYIPNDNNENED